MEKICKNCIYRIVDEKNCFHRIMGEIYFGTIVDENHTCEFIELKK
jgi:hypothetical protein